MLSARVSLWAAHSAQTQWIQQEQPPELRLPPSALAVASAVRIAGSAGHLNFNSCLDRGESKVQPSSEFLALCTEQLSECDKKLNEYKLNLTIYIRTPECFGIDELEFRKLGTVEHDLLLQFTSDADPCLQQVEVFLAKRRALELPDLNSLVVPLAREMCLVGLLVAEKPDIYTSALSNSDRPVVELVESVFSMEESRELVRLAQSLCLACVMEQRMALLRHVSWQKDAKIAGFLEQARGSLSALRTLGRLLLPQLKRGEVSRDVVQDILVQSDHMKEVLDEIQEALFNTKDDQLNERSTEWNYTSDKSLPDFTRESATRDMEAPMPPYALAPQDGSVDSCVVADVISELTQIGGEMVSKKNVKLELRVEPGAQGLSAAIDEEALRQGVSGLLENAIQRASHAGGWIITEVCRAPGGGILVTIEDNGVSTVAAQAMLDLSQGRLAQKLLESFGVVVRTATQGAARRAGSRVELWFPSVRGSIEAGCACDVMESQE